MIGTDWNDAVAIPFDYSSVLANGGTFLDDAGGQTVPVPAVDFNSTYYLKWDASNLYIACDITDADYVEDGNPADGTNNGDCAQLGFALNTTAGQTSIFDLVSSQGGGLAPTIFEHAISGSGYGITSASSIAGFVNIGTNTIEAAIAWSDLGYSPLAGDIHSMYLINPDFDSDGTRSYLKDNGDGAWGVGWADPADMNTMTLVPEPATMLMLSLGGIALIRRKR